MKPATLHQTLFANPAEERQKQTGSDAAAADACKCCRPLVTTLKWLSFDVRMDGQRTTAAGAAVTSGFDVWYARLWYVTLLLLDIRFLLEYLFGAYDTLGSLIEGGTVNIQALFFAEPLIGLVLLVSFVRNRAAMVATTLEIAERALALNRRDAYRSIARCSVMLAVLIAVLVVVNAGLAVYFTLTLEGVHNDNFNRLIIWILPSKRSRAVEQVLAMITYNTVLVTYMDIFCLYQIFQFHLLFQCYRQLNARAKRRSLAAAVTCRHLYEFQVEHGDIARLVLTINRLFSPSVFFFTVFSVVKMTAGFKSLINLQGAINGPFYNYYLINVTRIVSLFVATSITAAKIYNEARVSVDVMQEISLREPTCCTAKHKPLRNNDFKECHTTSLFVTQMTLDPVGISAFHMFTINYNLIAIVISTLATYLSAISTMDVAQYNSDSPFSGDD